ncbi:MAG: adenylate/guanylate cyclase domain-containing protein, partial [Nitrospirota bacterium]|nr:adenylate/guanylate cyclase domain-containing protein [Nitrospirota bacterium]
PLVWLPGWLSHLELDMGFPPIRDRCERLSKDFTLVRFDGRGTGLSQRGTVDFSLDSQVLDLEAVAADLGIEEFALVGYSGGGPIAIKFVDKHPDTVTHLVLIGAFATPAKAAGGPGILQAMMSITKEQWGLGAVLMAELMFGESADPAVHRAFVIYQQQAATAEDALKNLEAFAEIDVTDSLPRIVAKTLVLHGRDDRASPIENGQELAAGIKGARFLSFEGHHVPGRKQSAQMDEAIREFILGEAPNREASKRAEPGTPAGLVTILFTDIESSTALTQRLGDAKAQEVLHTHNTIVRDSLKAHDGTEIKHTGDGIMASFGSARRALESAITIQRAFASHNADHPNAQVRVRVGLNAGEPVAEDDDLFGTAVQLAARACAHAEPGQIVIPDGVRHLVAGKDFLFADLGDSTLKGFEDPVRLYELSWREEG